MKKTTNMKRLQVMVFVVGVVVIINGAVVAAPSFCAVGYYGEFAHIDPSNGTVTEIRNDLPLQMQALAWSPDGRLYAGKSGELFTIDPWTGDTDHFLTVSTDIRGMAFSPDGTLYVSGPFGLRTINLSDGSYTQIGLWDDIPNLGVQGMAFSPDGILFGIGPSGAAPNRRLFTIDTNDAGVQIILDDVEGVLWGLDQSLAFAPDGSLYALSGWFAELNPTDGSVIGSKISLGGSYRGLEAAVIPEPATYCVYVDADAIGENDGSSWCDAFNYLQNALGVARYGDEIWVAEGIYKPDEYTSHPDGTGDPSETFRLKNGVAIKGGYAGCGEPDPNARDIELYKTILSGDLLGNDNPDTPVEDMHDDLSREDNCYHVVTGSGTDDTAVLDGFTIIAGHASESLPDNIGGGMHNYWSSSPRVRNCTFSRNSANFGGGGMSNDYGSNPTLHNCLFSGNWTRGHGGGLANGHSTPSLTNCTFSENQAVTQGGGINNWEGTAKVANCILWGNIAPKGAQIYNDWAGSAIVTYSDIQGGWPGEGNINDDPLFIDADGADNTPGTIDDNLRLLAGSPCIDAGDNSVVDPCSTDIDGNLRIMDGDNDSNSVVDMGAYELLTPIEADVHIVPRVINRNNRLKRIMAIVRLPEGIGKGDVIRESFELYAGGLDGEPVGAILERVIGWGNMTRVFAMFDKPALMEAVPDDGEVELHVVGKLESGQYILGSDTVRIIRPRPRPRRRLRLR